MISSDYEHIGVGYAEEEENSWFIMMVGWIDESNTLSEASDASAHGYPYPNIWISICSMWIDHSRVLCKYR